MKRTDDRPAVLVLGLGNPLLRDDGIGLELLRRLREIHRSEHPEEVGVDDVEFVDGGTQGVALLGHLAGRAGLLVLDALALGDPPGTVSALRDPLQHLTPAGFGAHGANASGLLAAAQLLGDLPPDVVLVGITPAELHTRVGLSETAELAVPEAVELAEKTLTELRRAAAHETDPERFERR